MRYWINIVPLIHLFCDWWHMSILSRTTPIPSCLFVSIHTLNGNTCAVHISYDGTKNIHMSPLNTKHNKKHFSKNTTFVKNWRKKYADIFLHKQTLKNAFCNSHWTKYNGSLQNRTVKEHKVIFLFIYKFYLYIQHFYIPKHKLHEQSEFDTWHVFKRNLI